MFQTKFSSKRSPIISEAIVPSKNPSTDKLKRKSFLRKSINKVEIKQQPLKEQNTNIPQVNIDLTRHTKRPSHEPVQLCRKELSLQKQILLKELERKQQKMEQLRLTFRKIQTSKPLQPKPEINFDSRSKFKEGSSNRLTAYSPNIRYTARLNDRETPVS